MFLNEFFKFQNTLYTCKQPLMMAYERSESAWDNFGKFIYPFQPQTKTLIRKLERILIKLYPYLPTTPLGQDMTQGQFLNRV